MYRLTIGKEFQWGVSKDGNRLVAIDSQLYLEPISKRDIHGKESWDYRTYYPLRKPDFFKEFLELDPTPQKIIDFADKYGTLLHYSEEMKVILKEGQRLIEPIELWQWEIRRMKEAYNLWRRASAENLPWLSKHIEWKGSKAIYSPEPFPPSYEEFFSSDSLEIKEFNIETGDFVKAARVFLTLSIQRRFLEEAKTKTVFVWDKELGRSILSHHPETLLSVFWLQLARKVQGGAIPRECVICGKEFEVGAGTKVGGRRTDKKTCTPSCKKKLSDYGKLVRKLSSDGLNSGRISKQVPLNLETIKYLQNVIPRRKRRKK